MIPFRIEFRHGTRTFISELPEGHIEEVVDAVHHGLIAVGFSPEMVREWVPIEPTTDDSDRAAES